MKTVSNEVDKKLQDANKYADEKRGDLVQVSYCSILLNFRRYNLKNKGKRCLKRAQ